MIFLGAVILYVIEGGIQPEAFGSIPRAMWWSMATLTTVGYGDIYPMTPLGKLLASLLAILGIVLAITIRVEEISKILKKNKNKKD